MIVDDVRTILNERTGYYPDLAMIADRLFMNPRTLKRHLRKNGTGYRDLLIEAQKKDALIVLKSTDFNVEDAALKLGYNDSSNFYRDFKKLTGLTVAQHIKLIRD